jgi:tRNA pseudouridine32 synthase/23S rRNA pseudouridine746 synthase
MTASRLYLPKLDSPPPTILEYLFARFPQIEPRIWRERVARGTVTLGDGTPLRPDSPYRHGIFVLYRREAPLEPAFLENPRILYRDDGILIADKPHCMPVTPAGEYVERSLLASLERMTGLDTLTPIHRLDKDTAGILLFTVRHGLRAEFHRLFAQNRVEREYFALASAAAAPERSHWSIRNRLGPGQPWFRQQIVSGAPTAVTEIELLGRRSGIGLFRLVPRTGRKHQLRVHMASIGFPILGDPFYPEMSEKRDGDPPLQLLAKRLMFVDPRNGESVSFASTRELELPAEERRA